MFNFKSHLLNTYSFLRYSLWLKPAVYSVLSIFIIALILELQFHETFQFDIKLDKKILTTMLGVLTSSMLTVFVFAVGAIVAAYASATQAGSPRILNLILADSSTKGATSNFIAAFVYAATTTIALESEYVNEHGVFLIFCITVLVFYWVIYVFIFWMDAIAKLGQVPTLIAKANKKAEANLKYFINNLDTYCIAYDSDEEFKGQPIYLDQFGFVKDINFKELSNLCSEKELKLLLKLRIGNQVLSNDPVVIVNENNLDEEMVEKIKAFFVVVDKREKAQDPFFSFEIISEIAGKALSPGINDPGTALDVINRSTLSLTPWFHYQDDEKQDDKYILFDYRSATTDLLSSSFENIRQYGLSNLNVSKKMVASISHLINISNEKKDQEILKKYIHTLKGCMDQLLCEGYESQSIDEYYKSHLES